MAAADNHFLEKNEIWNKAIAYIYWSYVLLNGKTYTHSTLKDVTFILKRTSVQKSS